MPLLLEGQKLNVVSCDPSSVAQGVAAWELYRKPNDGYKRKLLGYKLIESGGRNVIRRVNEISQDTLMFSKDYKPRYFVIEQPPQTVYDQKVKGKRMSPAVVSQRAQEIFKLFQCYGATIQLHLMQFPRIEIIHLNPSQWQEHHSKRGGADTKEWSVEIANLCIRHNSEGLPELTRKKDHNIADAIGLGWVAIEHLVKQTLPADSRFSLKVS